MALATWSSLHETPLPPKTVVIGEVGLAGELRRVPSLQRRLLEAARLGYERAIVPAGGDADAPGMDITRVSTLGAAIAAVSPAK